MMGQSPSGDVALPHASVLFFSVAANVIHLPPFWLKMADFEGNIEVKSFQYFNLQ